MAAVELTEETRQQVERIGNADVVVGIAGAVSARDLLPRAERIVQELGSAASSLRLIFACPGASTEDFNGLNAHPALVLLPFASPPPAEFWAGVSANQRAILGLAASLNARVCIVIGSDLAALDARSIQLFSYAVLDRLCGLVMPVYPAARYDGLLNSGLLAPLSRALYGRRVRYPLAYDFAVSGSLCAALSRINPVAESAGNTLLWPITTASTQHAQVQVGQVHLDVHHRTATGDLELSTVVGQLVGSLFQDMDQCASHWQRIRGSQATPVWGNGGEESPDHQPIDFQPMLDTFQLGSKNLDEVWRLILPPNSLLELRRLARLAPEQFQMPDALWASLVYDFALAWRLRTISRGHLLGALTPLYLGWAASYVREVSSLSHAEAEHRLEQLARVWEEKKPYLLSRWRWPDRFNP
jgi:hypothetical protein